MMPNGIPVECWAVKPRGWPSVEVVRAVGPECGRDEGDVKLVADVVAGNLVGQGVPCSPIT